MLGADVFICGRRGGVVEETAKELMATTRGGKVVGIACDIRVAEAIDEMIDKVWADGGALDGLVNNAAGNFISRTEDLSPRGFDAIANIVFRGSFFVTLDCGKRWLPEGKHASVVSILTTWVWTRRAVHRALGHVQGGPERHDPVAGGRVGQPRHPLQRHRAGALPDRGRLGAAQPGRQATATATEADASRWAATARCANWPTSPSTCCDPGSAYVNGQTIAIDGGMGIMGNGTFSNMMAYSDDDWRRIREQIQATNASDKAKRKRVLS